MKYIVFVSKHHDGFAMYHTKVSHYNVVDTTPWKRDPLQGASAEACRRHNMRLGVYYSQAVDWHHPDGAGNSWDFDEKKKDFDKYLREKALPQVRELLTNYGPISTFWFDWPMGMTLERCQWFSDMARSLQPDMLINSRLGDKLVWPGPLVDYPSMGDDEIPNVKISGIWETAGTTQYGWGYNQYDQEWKSLSTIAFNLVDIVSKGGVYLLNTGPTSDGVIPKPAQDVFLGVGRWLKINGESIYGPGPTPFGNEFGSETPGKKDRRGNLAFAIKKDVRFTTKPDKLYIHIFHWPNGTLELTGLNNEVKFGAERQDGRGCNFPLGRSFIVIDRDSCYLAAAVVWTEDIVCLEVCIQCGTCGGSCPSAMEMDHTPRMLFAMLRAGMRDEVLRSNTPWLCVSCYHCVVRCPQEVHIADVMYTLKSMAIKAKLYTDSTAPHFSQTFVDMVETFGRSFELGLASRHYLRHFPLILHSMMPMGFGMITKGRMSIMPKKIKHMDQLTAILDRASQLELTS